MRAEVVIYQTRWRPVPLLEHEELLGIPCPFEEPFDYQIQAVDEGQEVQLDRLVCGRTHNSIIQGDHGRDLRDQDTFESSALICPRTRSFWREPVSLRTMVLEISSVQTSCSLSACVYVLVGDTCALSRVQNRETDSEWDRGVKERQ